MNKISIILCFILVYSYYELNGGEINDLNNINKSNKDNYVFQIIELKENQKDIKINLGDIDQHNTYAFQIRNIGEKVNNIKSDCGCTSSTLNDNNIQIILNPKNIHGSFSRNIIVNYENREQLYIEIKGNVKYNLQYEVIPEILTNNENEDDNIYLKILKELNLVDVTEWVAPEWIRIKKDIEGNAYIIDITHIPSNTEEGVIIAKNKKDLIQIPFKFKKNLKLEYYPKSIDIGKIRVNQTKVKYVVFENIKTIRTDYPSFQRKVDDKTLLGLEITPTQIGMWETQIPITIDSSINIKIPLKGIVLESK